MIIRLYTDGAARGNPGPAGLGVVIFAGESVHEYTQYLGETTNNQAEYQALIFALEKLIGLIAQENLSVEKVVCYSDSELLVRQMKRQYRVKDAKLALLFVKAWNLLQKLPAAEFVSIPREQNTRADKLANQAIEYKLKTQNQQTTTKNS